MLTKGLVKREVRMSNNEIVFGASGDSKINGIMHKVNINTIHFTSSLSTSIYIAY